MYLKNAKSLPKIFYGLHMAEGVAEYREDDVNGGKPYRIMIGEETIKNMNSTFSGKPVYVRHVAEVDLEKIQEEADGYVVESFFNTADGKHWAKFIVVSDRGHEAIRSGWKLSNAYVPKQMSSGGLWHGVEYEKEVVSGEYEHLAIVPNPRYEESIILSPEEFKLYNEKKELELKKLANSKGDKPMFGLFKKTKVENAAELQEMVVTLPKSKLEKPLKEVLNDADAHYANMQMPEHMANGEHHVMVGEEKMTVNELVAKHMALKAAAEAPKKEEGEKAEEGKDGEKKENEEKKEEKEAGEKKENEEKKDDKDAGEKKENEEKKDEKADEKKKENSKEFDEEDFFETLKNAPNSAIKEERKADLSEDKVARGKSRYGSGN